MRFQKYIKEFHETDINRVIEKIDKKYPWYEKKYDIGDLMSLAEMCLETIHDEDKVLKNIEFVMEKFYKKGQEIWRGFQRDPLKNPVKVRQDRKPVDTKKEIHEKTNLALQKHFGFHRGNSLFASTYRSMAQGYAKHGREAMIIYPIGKFDWLWSPDVNDFFADLNSTLPKVMGFGAWNKDVRSVAWRGINQSSERSLKEYFNNEFWMSPELGETGFFTYPGGYTAAMEHLDQFLKKTYKKNKPVPSGYEGELIIHCKEYYYG